MGCSNSEGLFDGSPNGWKKLIWRYNNDTFDVTPVEAYFSDFYHPGLLSDIFAGKRPKPEKQLANVDRRQIPVKMATAAKDAELTPQASRTITLQIDVWEAPDSDRDSDPTKNTAGRGSRWWPASGARDLRLFRNGSLVRLWPGDLFALDEKHECKLQSEAADKPRHTICSANVPIVAGPNRFTAYAFNQANIKSSDAEITVIGAEGLKRGGTAYIIAVGVNEYANKDYNLRYAVADAEDFGAEVGRQQEFLKQYEKVDVIPLYDKDATKENILLALKLLNGNDDLPAKAPASLGKLKKAEPEDLVMVYFAGHGTAHDNQFYLIPYDLGYTGSEQISRDEALKIVLTHSISDRELQAAFEKIDAARLLLVIDACNSGQALEAEEKRRGPMNSKGLAQLAYEKGMYVLAASQSDKAALEVSELKHGLLTYVLVEEGLKQGKAEKNEKGEIFERKWLDYATQRVPAMQIEQMKRRHIEIANTPPQDKGRGTELIFVEGDDPTIDPEKRNVQRPRVFYRRELENQPLIVAKQ